MSIKIYEVGGAVRDRLLGLNPKDIDYAVEAPSWDAMRQFIVDRGAKIFVETPKFLTIRAKDPKLGAVDFVLCRKDGIYKDGRHPDSVEVGDIYDDLARRDFTVNAMARDLETNQILDPHNGKQDLENKFIRFVGDGTKRLEEDRLRAYRAIRFVVTKGFELHPQTATDIFQLGWDENTFKHVSTERIREELNKMFAANTKRSFNLLFDKFKYLGEEAINRGIWFKPTVESK